MKQRKIGLLFAMLFMAAPKITLSQVVKDYKNNVPSNLKIYGDAGYYFEIANSAMENESYEKAIDAYTSAISLMERDQNIFHSNKVNIFAAKQGRAWAYSRAREYRESLSDLDDILQEYKKGYITYCMRANVLSQMGNYNDALNDEKLAYKYAEDLGANYLSNIVVLEIDLNQFFEAEKYYKEYESRFLSRQAVTYIETNKVLKKYVLAGTKYLRLNDYDAALKLLLEGEQQYLPEENQASYLKDNYANLLAKIGWIYEQLGNTRNEPDYFLNAVNYYRKAAAFNPNVQKAAEKIVSLTNLLKVKIREDRQPPKIYISPNYLSPKDSTVVVFKTSGQRDTIRGFATDLSGIASIKVNKNVDVIVNSDGNFAFVLQRGEPLINLVCSDGAGNIATKRYNVIYPTINERLKALHEEKLTTVKPVFHAVFIACSKYNFGNPNFLTSDDLPHSIDEVESLKKELINEYGFLKENIETVYDQSAEIIMSVLDSKIATLKDRDNLLIVYAGHGDTRKKDNEDFGYWIPPKAQDREHDCISNEQLSTAFINDHARHTLIIADNCYGGLMKGANLPISHLYETKSIQTLSGEDGKPVPIKSAFLPLVKGALMQNKNDSITAYEIRDNILLELERQTNGQNIPKIQNFEGHGARLEANQGGQFFFIRN